jgi:hypothetical protein
MYCEALLGEQLIVAVVIGLTQNEQCIIVRFFGIEHKIPIDDVSIIADTVSELIVAKTSMSEAEKLDSIHTWLMNRRRAEQGDSREPIKKKLINRYASAATVPRENSPSPQASTPSRGTVAATLPRKTTSEPQATPRASPQAAQHPAAPVSHVSSALGSSTLGCSTLGCSIALSHSSFVIFFEPNDKIPPRYASWERRTSIAVLPGMHHRVLYRVRTDGTLVEASAVQR